MLDSDENNNNLSASSMGSPPNNGDISEKSGGAGCIGVFFVIMYFMVPVMLLLGSSGSDILQVGKIIKCNSSTTGTVVNVTDVEINTHKKHHTVKKHQYKAEIVYYAGGEEYTLVTQATNYNFCEGKEEMVYYNEADPSVSYSEHSMKGTKKSIIGNLIMVSAFVFAFFLLRSVLR